MKVPPAAQNRPDMLHLQLLGGFAVQLGETTIPEAQWKSHRARSLVKLLALAPGHRLHRDQAIDALWPDAGLSAAANSLHQTLFAARRVLDTLAPGCLTLDEGFLSLSGGEGQALSVDVEQFETVAVQARKTQDAQSYQSALALYAGELLPEDRYEEWTLARREALQAAYLELLLDLGRIYAARQEYPAGIETLQRLLGVDGGNEEAHAALMRLYAANGQRQQALRQYELLRKKLQVELEVEPSSATQELYEAIQSGKLDGARPAADLQSTPIPHHNLPSQLSSFIGREKEMAEVGRLLGQTRLLTLTGVGGTGKTRLALAIASQVIDGFEYGAWLAELAPLNDPALILYTLTGLFGLRQESVRPLQDTLNNYLRGKSLLLLLDNCEHLVKEAARLTDEILRAAPQVKVLATSREALGLGGEIAYPVPSLQTPDAKRLPPMSEMMKLDAVRLFVERARAAQPAFALTEASATAVAQICQRLDGIPLAIELAAARVKVLSAEHIAGRLDNRFRLLTGGSRNALPRHQTLHALIEWSYGLLSEPERKLFRCLSAFRGGWTLEAAEALCPCGRDESFDVLENLAGLVNKSLVDPEMKDGQVSRYRMLETIRQFAQEKLLESGDSEELRDLHLAYFANLTSEAEPHLRARGQVEWMARLDDELDNLRVAMEWGLAADVERGLQIMADTMWFWWIRGMLREGSDWMKRLLAAETDTRGEAPLEGNRALQRARGLRVMRYLTSNLFYLPMETREAIMLESIDLLRRLGPLGRRELGISLLFRYMYTITPEGAQELLDIFQQLNDKFYISEYLFHLSGWAYTRGDFDQQESNLKDSLAISREIEDFDGISSRCLNLAYLSLQQGDYLQAEVLTREAIEASRKVKNRWWEMLIQTRLVDLALAQGKYEEATRLSNRIEAWFKGIDYPLGNAITFIQLIVIAWAQGNYAQAASLAGKMVETFPDHIWAQIQAHYYLGRTSLYQGDTQQAGEHLWKSASLLLLTTTWDVSIKTQVLVGWAALFEKQAKYAQAARFLGVVDEVYRHTAMALPLNVRVTNGGVLATVRAALGEQAFARAWEEGKAMTPDQALVYAKEHEG
jgi:predicted ATPase/DNA-binding SARP family transcriptional activator